MDRLNPEKKKEKEREGKKSIKERVKEQISLSLDRRKEDRLAPVLDILTFIVGILFARCHIIFGSHPIAIAFISVLPTRVWLSVLGSCVGSLTLGGSGIIYAMISVIVVFLRIIVSGTDKKDIGTVEGGNT